MVEFISILVALYSISVAVINIYSIKTIESLEISKIYKNTSHLEAKEKHELEKKEKRTTNLQLWGNRMLIVVNILFIIVILWNNKLKVHCFAQGKTEIVWQQSEANSVQLGIRDKYGDLKSYKALFVVKDASGKEYKAEKDIKDSAWAYVYFPGDFKVYGNTGDYTWEGIVNGKVVASGKFRLNMINER